MKGVPVEDDQYHSPEVSLYVLLLRSGKAYQEELPKVKAEMKKDQSLEIIVAAVMTADESNVLLAASAVEN